MGQIKDQMMQFLAKKDIDVLVSQLAQQIERDYEGKEIVFVCPLRGSIHFVADLMRKITLAQQVDFVYVTTVEKGGAIKIVKDISIS